MTVLSEFGDNRIKAKEEKPRKDHFSYRKSTRVTSVLSPSHPLVRGYGVCWKRRKATLAPGVLLPGGNSCNLFPPKPPPYHTAPSPEGLSLQKGLRWWPGVAWSGIGRCLSAAARTPLFCADAAQSAAIKARRRECFRSRHLLSCVGSW